MKKLLPLLVLLCASLGWFGFRWQPPQLTQSDATCLSNEMQLEVGVRMYVQDYDEVFPRKKGLFKDMVYPYVKNNQVFQCPLDAKGTISYVMNPNLLGVHLAAVKFPGQTVLLYEGKNMQFDFKHNGRTALTLVDGHAKLLLPEDTKKVIWYPAGKKPAPAAPMRSKPKSRHLSK